MDCSVTPAARPLRLPRPAPAPRRSSQPRRHRSAAPPAARRLHRPHFSPIQSHRSPHLVAGREREGSREREGRVTEVERRRSGMNWFGRFCRTNSSRILKEYSSFGDEFIPTFSNQTLQKKRNGAAPSWLIPPTKRILSICVALAGLPDVTT